MKQIELLQGELDTK